MNRYFRVANYRKFASSPLSRVEQLRSVLKSEHGNEEPAASPVASSSTGGGKVTLPKPNWLRAQVPSGNAYEKIRKGVKDLGLATVCQEARCPNIGECWSGGEGHVATATIMIMGEACTRACSFCAVKTKKKPPALDPLEPERVSEAIRQWDGIEYIVITSVTRDDLTDQGAEHFAKVATLLKQQQVTTIRDAGETTTTPLLVECLTPDFNGDYGNIKRVVESGLDVYAHNIETVERLQGRVRDRRASYARSMDVLRIAKQVGRMEFCSPDNPPTVSVRRHDLLTKTSIMLGLGETDAEIEQTLSDLRSAEVDIVTLGQYLKPSKYHMSVQEYVTPEKFDYWHDVAVNKYNFKYVASGPLVRSSYRAGELFVKGMLSAK
jgi:lipoyl synthase